MQTIVERLPPIVQNGVERELGYIVDAKGECCWCHAQVDGEAVEELIALTAASRTPITRTRTQEEARPGKPKEKEREKEPEKGHERLYHPRCFVKANVPLFENLKGATPEA